MDIKTLKEAALKFGTPIYLYDLKIIQNQFDKLIKELSVLNDYKIHFAAKSLSNISILKFVRRQGAGLDAVSIEEVRIGLKCGFLKDEIIYTPNGVCIDEIVNAHNLGVKINLDSIESINEYCGLYKNPSINIRINPEVYAGANERISVGHANSKFGIPIKDISKILKLEKEGKVNVVGIHMHTGSDILKNEQLKEGIKIIFSTAEKFKNIKSIDFGGGIKVPYFKGDTETDLSNYIKNISIEYDRYKSVTGRDLQLIFEPGKFLVSDSGFFICKVNFIKSTPLKNFVQINTGFNHFIRPNLYGAYHEITNLSNPNGKKFEYEIVGYICEKDTFAEKRRISKISKGDLICIRNAGAYGYNMASNYNSRPRPAEICLYKEKLYKIREAEDLNSLLKNQIDIFS